MLRPPPRSPPFPTRRSSDLKPRGQLAPQPPQGGLDLVGGGVEGGPAEGEGRRADRLQDAGVEDVEAGAYWTSAFQSRDRKSTRLNSSHLGISYAVFCLKKKK